MQSIQDYIRNKKGVLGLDTATKFVLALLTLAVIGFAVIIALDNLVLSDTDVLGTNNTENILRNVSAGTASLFENATTWFSLIAIVIIILIIAVVIIAVKGFGGGERL